MRPNLSRPSTCVYTNTYYHEPLRLEENCYEALKCTSPMRPYEDEDYDGATKTYYHEALRRQDLKTTCFYYEALTL